MDEATKGSTGLTGQTFMGTEIFIKLLTCSFIPNKKMYISCVLKANFICVLPLCDFNTVLISSFLFVGCFF